MRTPTPQPIARGQQFPKGALYAAGALILLTFILVLGSRIAGLRMDWVPDADITASRDVRFGTGADGAIVITDARSGDILGRYAQETNAFVRSVANGLLIERRLADPAAADAPYRITRWSDGRVTVTDPISGRFVELGAFGQSQVQTFSRLLPPSATN
jgi:putative photosynthetic complex assembly protein